MNARSVLISFVQHHLPTTSWFGSKQNLIYFPSSGGTNTEKLPDTGKKNTFLERHHGDLVSQTLKDFKHNVFDSFKVKTCKRIQ